MLLGETNEGIDLEVDDGRLFRHEVPPVQDGDEIDLLDLLSVLLRRKWLIVGITATAALLLVIFSFLSIKLPPTVSMLPNEYTPKALMLINDSASEGGGLSSLLNSSGLSGLASMAGLSSSLGSTNSGLAVYLATTNNFLDAVIDEFSLIERYEIKESVKANSRKELEKRLSAEYDEESGVFSLSYTDIDPQFARDVVNFCVGYFERRFEEMGLDQTKLQKENLETNIKATYEEIGRLETESRELQESVSMGRAGKSIPSIVMESERIKLEIEAQKTIYTQLKTQYELVKVSMASEKPVFQILEYAEAPDMKSGPSRGMICIVGTMAAFFLSILIVFLLNAIDAIRKDPVAMAKLGSSGR